MWPAWSSCSPGLGLPGDLAACASADTTNVFSIGSPRGGSLEHPQFLYTIREPGVDGHVGRWHSAAFTWDGKVLVLGWEPGGGGLPYRAAAQRPLRGGQRQLPGRDLGHRLHRPGQPGERGLVGPSAARTGPRPDRATGQRARGAWSSYWYNNFVFESEITKGLNVFRVSDPRLAGALVLGHLNPQTQEFTIG